MICEFCKIECKPQKGKYKDINHIKRFCSRKCKVKAWWQKNLTPKKRFQYKLTYKRLKRFKICIKCKHPLTHKHHIIPRYLGGLNERSNYVRLCANCHEIIHILYRINNNKDFQQTFETFLRASLLDSIEIIKSNIKPLVY